MLDRVLCKLIPNRFLIREDAFRAKVLWVYSTVLGLLGVLIIIMISLSEGELPLRRLGTAGLTISLLAVTFFMGVFGRLGHVSAYVCVITMSLIFYVDFNNLSIAGPTLILWIVPVLLIAFLFSGWHLLIFVAATFLLFGFNVYALFNGWLPEPLIHPDGWVLIKIMYVVCAAIMVLTCTRGMWNLSQQHLAELEEVVKNKQEKIEEVNQLKLEAESSTRSKSIFLATMSHELRTPLNSMIGNAQLLARAELPEKHHARVNDIALAGNLLLMLINDILDFSKLEENQIKLIEEPYDLTEQVSEIARIMETKLKEHVNLKLKLPDEKLYINGDKNRLAQVLMNLISNAMKFTDVGEVAISLERVNKSGVRISISDTGIGIKKEDQKNLFTQFSQFSDDSTRNMEGTGLGLAISMGLVKSMQGSISVTSEPNIGSCFTVDLPGRVLANCHIEKQEDSSVDIKLSLAGRSILVVDDIAMNCMVLESMLMEFGADTVLSVNSGEEAIDYIAENMDTNLILMDMRMPGMGGVEATQNIRNMGFSNLVVAVTANASEQDKQACIDVGMNGFIAKPIAIDALEEVLTHLFHA
nr:ATP-binding protein [Bermanella sp. WJH001]MDJ1537379.1 ATP-binding protein [Bermanella sp. WJH001]